MVTPTCETVTQIDVTSAITNLLVLTCVMANVKHANITTNMFDHVR